jgi:hypothetical protein
MKKNAFTGPATAYDQQGHGVGGECWVWNFRMPLAQALGTNVDVLIMSFFQVLSRP